LAWEAARSSSTQGESGWSFALGVQLGPFRIE
jgi:hypothetical protein